MPGVGPTIREWEAGKLRSGSKTGPKVTSRKQAIAIALSEEAKAGKVVPARPGPAVVSFARGAGSKSSLDTLQAELDREKPAFAFHPGKSK